MFNLKTPKLTKQEKVFLHSLQTDSKFKKEVDREKAKGNNICFPSYWVVNTEDLIRFNRAAHQIDTAFDFYKEWLELIFPYHQNLLFEGERVEIGQWDKTYERWSPHSYQRVGVVFLDGVFDCITDKGIWIKGLQPIEERKNELEKEYPYSFGNDKKIHSFGVLDIPLHCLDEYEDKRVYKRTYAINEPYRTTKKEQLKRNWNCRKKQKKQSKKPTNPLVEKLRHKKKKGGFG